MGLVGLSEHNVYKTEPIFTGLGHGKFSLFLTLLCIDGQVFTNISASVGDRASESAVLIIHRNNI